MRQALNMTSITRAVAVAIGALAFTVGAQAAGDKAVYEQAQASAKAQYETAKKQCDSLGGNAKDVCQEEAKAARKKSEAEAEAAYKGTPKAQHDAKVNMAEADYDVAKERCDDMSGDAKNACVKDAKATLARAKADAKAERDGAAPSAAR